MSLRHFQRTLAASFILAAAAISTASATVFQSGWTSPEMIQPLEAEGELSFRGSGRLSDQDLLAYRASGRFHNGFEGYMISYRGSERGVDTLAYRASGRFDSGAWGYSLLSEILEQDEQTVAYRASGRLNGGFESYMISYRGSERGVSGIA